MTDKIPHDPIDEDERAGRGMNRKSTLQTVIDAMSKVPKKKFKETKLGKTLAGDTTVGKIGGFLKDGLTYVGVLPKLINKASDAIGAKFQTKERGNMNWILNRLQERSTWRGIVGLATAIGLGLEPDQVTAIVTLGVAAAAAVEVFFKEPQSEDAKQ